MTNPSALPQDLEILIQTLERRVAEMSQALEKVQKPLEARDRVRLKAWDMTDTGFCIVDEKGIFVDMNPAYSRIYGYSREELLGKPFTMVLAPGKREMGQRDLTLFFKNGEESSTEREAVHKEGRPLWVFASRGILQDEAGKRYKIASVIDVTQARRDRELQLRFGYIFGNMKDEIFFINKKTLLFEEANASALVNSGYSLDELRALHVWELFTGVKEAELLQKLAGDIQQCGDCSWIFTGSVCRKNKTCYEAEIRLQRMQTGEGDEVAFAMLARDITESMSTLRTLKESEEALFEAQQMAGMGSWRWEYRTGKAYWSDQVYKIMGISKGEAAFSLDDFLEKVVPEDRPRVQEALKMAIFTGKTIRLEHRVYVGDALRILAVSGKALKDEEGRVQRFLGTIQDITEKKRVEAELHKLSMAIEQSTNIIFITDKNGIITYVNSVFEKITGYSKKEAIGQNPRILASGETRPEAYAVLWRTILSGHSWRGHFKNKTKTGTYYWGKGLISPVRGLGGEIVNFLAIQEDITEKRQAEERTFYLETHDVQTGILNRDSFLRRLGDSFSSGGAGMLIDIDNFNLVNDQIGYARGDQVLRSLIQGIGGLLDVHLERETWFMGRFGGDQVVVFSQNIGVEECLALGEKIRIYVEARRFKDEGLHLTVSVGLGLIPKDAGDSVTFLAVLGAALNKAKELGKNRCRIFVPEDREREVKRAIFCQKQRTLDALSEDRLEVWYQPILHLSSQTILHYEALVRLREPDGRILLPGAFIKAAEYYGLVGSIDRIVARKTFFYQVLMEKKGHMLSFAINLSGRDLADAGMAAFLKQSIEETGADPKRIIFEITETAAIQDMDRALEFIGQMKALGCRFSLDDFGVGFTNFVYLREMQVDFIKIDGSFVQNLHERPEDRSVVRAIAQMAKEMGIRTVAEFVEKPETLTFLSEIGVDYAQGFLIGKPAPFPMGLI